ncbi:MAG: UPF0280 family protein [Gammaproteobacteria bacterium]|nr:UPF0280 family protein [Gammaproteobacteria bacterium]
MTSLHTTPGANGIQIGRVRENLHLNHGPIDLLIHADGDPGEVSAAYRNASHRFETVLTDLVQDLPLLRQELSTQKYTLVYPTGNIARQMFRACLPHRSARLSPMAAIAGAVADTMLSALNKNTRLRRAWVNNGGDIAFSLQQGQRFCCGLVPEIANAGVQGELDISAGDPVRGIATSGRAALGQGGRSFSLGIADAVTVLAKNAASADVAATLIANHVDLPEHNDIRRCPAAEMDPDSDLGQRLVTTGVPPLTGPECRRALERGARYARQLQSRGQIHCAILFLQKKFTVVGNDYLGLHEATRAERLGHGQEVINLCH